MAEHDLGTRGAVSIRAGVRGLVAAMAMSGMRGVTANVGLVAKSPPEAIVERHAPRRIRRLAAAHRAAVTEIAHWAYGAVGGVVFGLLPRRLGADRRTGSLYGPAVRLVFEPGIGPLLGVQYPEQRRPPHRTMLALGHALYGVVAGRLAPAPEIRPS